MMASCNKCFGRVEKKLSEAFRVYGKFVARHPWKIVAVAIIVNGILSIGIIRLNLVLDTYIPIDSQSSNDNDYIRSTFPDLSGSNFMGYHMPDRGRYGSVIVRPKNGNALNTTILGSLSQLYTFVTQISTIDANGNVVQFSDICAMVGSSCSVDGDLFFDNEFIAAVSANSIDFPFFSHSTRGPIYYEQLVGGASAVSGTLQSASMLRLTFNLRTDSDYYVETSKNWQASYLDSIGGYQHAGFDIAYSHVDSLSKEVDKNVTGDMALFVVTISLMITYVCIATLSARCDVVGQRSNLGFAGVLAAGLAIVAAFGVGSACGVEFVSTVGSIPFLIIGIGVDDMFLLLSGITNSDYSADLEMRIGDTMATSGVSITITTLTDLLAFAAGASSVFLSVRNYCIYCCLAVVFCYLNQATLFIAAITINEKRTNENRHFATCKTVKYKPRLIKYTDWRTQTEGEGIGTESVVIRIQVIKTETASPSTVAELKENGTEWTSIQTMLRENGTASPSTVKELRENGTKWTSIRTMLRENGTASSITRTALRQTGTSPENIGIKSKDDGLCYSICCSGRPAKNQQESESYIDKLPQWLIPKLIVPLPMKILILMGFGVYLGMSIYGVTRLGQGLDLKLLVAEDSYYYKYSKWYDTFPQDTIVSFVFNSEMTYSDVTTEAAINNFTATVKSDSTVDSNFEINWFSSFDSSADKSSEAAYIASLQAFLSVGINSRFQNDVVIDTTRNVIMSSRIHLISEGVQETQEQGKFMLRMRELACDNSLSVIAFSPAFLFYEQYVIILSQTLQTVGIAVAMVFFVTCIFLPHPFLLLCISGTVAMITLGIFGFLPFLGLTLSALTMVHIVMSIGFSVDFAVHICHAYVISSGKTRDERMQKGIQRSGAPIFHGAISSLLGVVVLGFAKSFIFFSFFQITSLMVTLGVLHATLFLPVVLSLIGPATTESRINDVDTVSDKLPNGL